MLKVYNPIMDAFRKHGEFHRPIISQIPEARKDLQYITNITYQAPALNLPTQEIFQLYATENKGVVLKIVTQLLGGTPQSVRYLCKDLDKVTKGWP